MMHRKSCPLDRIKAVTCLSLLALACSVCNAQAVDYGGQLRRDAQALHDDIAANHPGMVNAVDAGFTKRNDDALATALSRAARVTGFAGWWYALRAYGASFDDGHLNVSLVGDTPPDAVAWPGFLTGYDSYGDQRVLVRDADAKVPLGAKLLDCDGRLAGDLAAANVGAFNGRWFLSSMRVRRGGELFVDRGNPFVQRPAQCDFEFEGKTLAVDIAWRAIDATALRERLAVTAQISSNPIGARTLWDGTRWFSLGSFNGDPSSPAGQRLPRLIGDMKLERANIVAAPAIVLDLRGNGGGSSDWSRQIAEVLWGYRRVAALDDDKTYVEWRVSDANIASLSATRESMRRGGAPSAEVMAWLDRAIGGLQAAKTRGEPLWREPADPVSMSVVKTDVVPTRTPIFFVTDAACGSACLDAADLWRALGAIQIGQQTSADTIYMDIRHARLPSGAANVSVPMKVYRGRERGANVPLEPVHRFPGDLRDTEALERWVPTLPEVRKRTAPTSTFGAG
ncbi:S41 family peptidase [soil metagenome]